GNLRGHDRAFGEGRSMSISSQSCRSCFVGTVCLVSAALAPAATWYVRASATGANNGTSWADAFTSLQSALAAAHSGDEIRVAIGTYKPAPDGGNPGLSFFLITGVQILGGSAG